MAATKKEQPYVLTRGLNSGVVAGFLVDRTASIITLRDARQVWEWFGPETITALAVTGPGEGANKIDKPAPIIELNADDVAATVHCTAEATARFAAIAPWSK